MTLLVGFVISWLLIACAIAWAVGKASDVGRPVQEPAPAARQARRPYTRRRAPGKVMRQDGQHGAVSRQVPNRASRSVH